MKFLKFLTFSTIFISIHCYATVSGGQNIEVLGYEEKEKKLYLLRHYEDGRGRLPQLYYYQLNNKSPEKLIKVQSLYINPKTHKVDYDQDSSEFNKALKKIKKRLDPLIASNTKTVKIQILRSQQKQISMWFNPTGKITQYKTEYFVKTLSLQSKNQIAIHYAKAIKISQNYTVPKQNKRLVIVKYLGVPEEGGYDIEDPVLLLPMKR
ncbi:hypothetical protein B9X71_07800 [Acinetobacter baumannii]|uniref:hypothetical protein n=1 Tax=Acinetobacter baumannii TaxID=470 RepID=UPI000A336609|nr:hypothetical protein [Acinetobacter baumannii]MCT9166199.1 hypothetical protein [Acinetobacter baumannii]MCT9173606.1 hypothetical protein [Acinetobacter baumannii]MCT9179967.1 hypothetical protein [Acinetobacter baumannii]OTK48159.1 hypothetical protein B9X71_07800 [Acinetobacter baumannii]